MESAFFCELKPTLLNQQHPVKFNCTFYVTPGEDGNYIIKGVSSRGKKKEGELSLVESDGDGRFEFEGRFLEGTENVSVELEIDLVDSDITFGGGVWVERSGGNLRQKYGVIVRGIEEFKGYNDFLDHIVNGYENVSSAREEVEEKVSELESIVDSLKTSAEEFISDQESLTSTKDDAESLEDELNDLVDLSKDKLNNIKELEKRNEKEFSFLGSMLADVNVVKEEAELLKRRAEEALSSAITVSIAKSFKERKQEAIRQRWIYDMVFVISLVCGIILTYNFVDFSESNGLGFVANIETLMAKLPFLFFFIWLGMFSSSKSKSASRIEEFYAQKQTLAESYEGYKSELSGYDGDQEDLAKLMAINLFSISKDSSSIFEKEENYDQGPVQGYLIDNFKRIIGKKKKENEGTGDSHNTDGN